MDEKYLIERVDGTKTEVLTVGNGAFKKFVFKFEIRKKNCDTEITEKQLEIFARTETDARFEFRARSPGVFDPTEWKNVRIIQIVKGIAKLPEHQKLALRTNDDIFKTYIFTGKSTRFIFSNGIKEVDEYGGNRTKIKQRIKQKYAAEQFELIRIELETAIPEDRKPLRLKVKQRKHICVTCKSKFLGIQMVDTRCRHCHEKHLEVLRQDARILMETDLEPYKETMEHCLTGVCDMLHVHKERLKNDPERLKTEFMIGLICGSEMAEKYRKKTMGGKIE